MTPEEQLDEARGEEAVRLWDYVEDGPARPGRGAIATIAARLAREGWTPPEPEPADPDVLAFREWGAADCEADGWTAGATLHRQGHFDISEGAAAFLAGARMARERERERAKVLVEFVGGVTTLGSNDSISAIVGVARFTLAKYRGEA